MDRTVQTGYKNDIKQLIKFRVAFQLIQCPLELDINNTELTQELVNLLNLSSITLKLTSFYFRV